MMYSRLSLWIQYTENDALLHLSQAHLYDRRLCSAHFTPDAFANRQRTYLKKTACPTLPKPAALHTGEAVSRRNTAKITIKQIPDDEVH